MTDVKSEGVRSDAPPDADDAPADPTIILEDQVPASDTAEVERLRSELAVTQERLRAMEELAKERAGRIADLRVILRMLPPVSQGVTGPPEPPPSSLIWVPDRAGTPGASGEPPVGPARGSWTVAPATPRTGEHSDRIWQRSSATKPAPGPGTSTVGGPTVQGDDHEPSAPTVRPQTGPMEWRDDAHDDPPPRHRRRRFRPWFGRLRGHRD